MLNQCGQDALECFRLAGLPLWGLALIQQLEGQAQGSHLSRNLRQECCRGRRMHPWASGLLAPPQLARECDTGKKAAGLSSSIYS